MATTAHWTLQQLEAEGGPPGPWEVINGEMIPLSPGGFRHSQIGLTLVGRIQNENRKRPAGYVIGPDAGIVIAREPLTLRAPDVGFVLTGRIPVGFDRDHVLPIVPDFVAEIISPSDRGAAVAAKVDLWLRSGCQLVWLIEPRSETVTVYTPDTAPMTLTAGQTLSGVPGLPGLHIAVADLFPDV